MFNRHLFLMIIITTVTLIAVGAIAIDHGGDDPLPNEQSYTIYMEVIGEDGSVGNTTTVTFTAEKNLSSFASAATAAFAAKGVPLKVETSSYGITMSYEGDLTIACWVSKGGKWTAVSDTMTEYIQASLIGLAVKHGYISESVYNALPASEKSKWVENEWGAGTEWAYMKIPDLKASGLS